MSTLKHFALAATVLLLAAALLAPPLVEAAPASPTSVAIAGYSGPPAAAVAAVEEPLNEPTSARKGLDIAEDGADAAATAAKAGSQTTGSGRFKALQDYLRNRRVACGGRACAVPDKPLPSPDMGSSEWTKFTERLRRTFGYSDNVIDKTYVGIRQGVIDTRYVSSEKLAQHIDDFYKTHADGIDIFSDAAGEEELIRLWGDADYPDKGFFFEHGDSSYGDFHLDGRHIDGRLTGQPGKRTSFWPCGKEVRPGVLTPDVMTKNDVLNTIGDSIKYGTKEIQGYNIVYEWSPNSFGVSRMRTVTTIDGKFITSYPLEGANVVTVID